MPRASLTFLTVFSALSNVAFQDFDGWLAQQLSHTATSVRFDASEIVPTRRPVPASAPPPSAARQAPRRAGSVSPTGLARFLECAHPVPKPGVIVLMTAEGLDGVSECLLQPGRIDCVLHFKNATRAMAEHLFRQFFMKVRSDPDLPYMEATVELASKEWAQGIKDGEFNLSTLKNMLVEHVYNPEGAAKAMPAWIAKHRSTRDTACS